MRTDQQKRAAAERRRTRERTRRLPAGDGGDEGPADIDEFRMSLARRMATFLGAWRDCTQPGCRRHHACVDTRMHCSARERRLTPKESARAAASMYKALQRTLASRRTEDAPARASRRED
jgi:hypothetical protein